MSDSWGLYTIRVEDSSNPVANDIPICSTRAKLRPFAKAESSPLCNFRLISASVEPNTNAHFSLESRIVNGDAFLRENFGVPVRRFVQRVRVFGLPAMARIDFRS